MLAYKSFYVTVNVFLFRWAGDSSVEALAVGGGDSYILM